MRVAVHAVDGIVPNLALMKLAAWHRSRGDSVSLWMPLIRADLIYASKVFTFTRDDPYLPDSAIRGGTGWGMYDTILTEEQEQIMPAYDIFGQTYSSGFVTRGCIRNCDFCVVPRKEGRIRKVASLNQFLNRRHKSVVFFDNNILALPDAFQETADECISARVAADWNQALDIRLVTNDVAQKLKKVKRKKLWRFSFDSIKYENGFRRGAERLLGAGHKPDTICVFIFVSHHEGICSAITRARIAWREYGFHVFAMLYKDPSGKSWHTNELEDMRRLRLWANNWNNKRAKHENIMCELSRKYDVEWGNNLDPHRQCTSSPSCNDAAECGLFEGMI